MTDKTEELISRIFDIAPICGCGQPEEALERLLVILDAMASFSDEGRVKRRIFYTEDNENNIDLLLILYFLDDMGYTEHGSSVYGAWLSDKGKELLKVLKEWEKQGKPRLDYD